MLTDSTGVYDNQVGGGIVVCYGVAEADKSTADSFAVRFILLTSESNDMCLKVLTVSQGTYRIRIFFLLCDFLKGNEFILLRRKNPSFVKNIYNILS